MSHAFTIVPQTYTAFGSEAEQLDMCKEWGLLSDKATKTKTFFYKRSGVNLACSIAGYVDKITAVIEFEDQQLHCIHPSYLKEMQAASYGQKTAAAVDEPAPADAEAGLAEEDAAASASDEILAEAARVELASDAGLDEEDEAGRAGDEGLDEQAEAGRAGEAAAQEQDAVEAAAEAEPPKQKGKKEKAPKLELPEHKVKMIATVQEFTTVPNNFSDNDDEVIIYEAVAITDPELAIGTAWSSNSATMKKLELNVGDTITFEAKVIAKKLTKHPVAYKINNPGKLQKVEA